MLFIHPMWDSETQRVGMQRCTPAGYTVHAVGELIGFIGLLLVLATAGFLVWKALSGTFQWALLWWIALPLGLGIVSQVMVTCSWWMDDSKTFCYDAAAREASWLEKGERRTFRYQSH